MLPRPVLPKPITVGFVVIAVMVAVLTASTYLLFSWDGIPTALETAIEKGLGQAGLDVEIGDLQAGFGSSLRLNEVRVDFPNEQGYLVIPETTVYFSWPKLLANLTNPVQALTRIHLVQPQGKFDLANVEALGASEPGKSDLRLPRLTLRITKGAVKLDNFHPELNEQLVKFAAAAGINLSNEQFQLTPLNIDLNIDDQGQVAVRGDLSIPDSLVAPLKVKAQYSPDALWQAVVSLDNLDLASFTELANQYQDYFTLAGGAASTTVYLTNEPDQAGFSWVADLWLHQINGTLDEWEVPIKNLQGGLRVTSDRVDVLGLRANVDGEVLESTGVVHVGERIALDLQLTGSRLNLGAHPKLWEKLIPTGTMEKVGGQASVNLNINGNLDSPVLAGRVSFAGVEADLLAPTRIPISDLSGVIGFAGDQVWTDRIFFRLAEQPISVHGQVLLGASPYFNFGVTTEQLGLGRVVAWLDQHGLSAAIPGFLRGNTSAPIQGDLSLSGTVLGTLRAPLIAGQVSLAKGQVAGVPVESLSADFDYVSQTVNLRNVDLCLPQNQQLKGNISLTKAAGEWGYSGLFRYTDLLPAWLAEVLPDSVADLGQVGGRASGEFIIEGGFDGLPNILSGNLRLEEPTWADGLVQTVKADWAWQAGAVTVKYLEAVSDVGRVSLTGKYDWPSQTIEAQAFGHELGLAAISQRLAKAEVSVAYLDEVAGQASVRAKISGTIADPELSGSLVVTDPSWRQEQFDLLTAAFAYNDQVLSIKTAELSQGLARLSLSGQVNELLGTPQLFLQADLANIAAAKLQKMSGTELPVEGVISADLNITGRWPQPQVKGAVKLTDGIVRDIPVQEVAATIFYKQGLFEASQVSATISGATLTGDGRYANGQVEAALDLTNLRLATLETLGLPTDGLNGVADLTGVLTGPLAELTLTGEIAARNVAYQGYQVKDVKGLFGYAVASRTLELNSIRLSQDQTSLQVAGNVVLAEVPTYDLGIKLHDGSISDLTKFFPKITWPEVVGDLSGQVHVAGIGSEATGRGTLQLAKLSYAGFTYDGQADLAYEDGELKLYNASLWDERGEIRLSGSYQLGGEFNLAATGSRVDISPIAAAIRPGLVVSGNADLAATLAGTLDDPRGQVEFTVTNGEAAGVALDDLGGKLNIDSTGLYLSGVTVVTGKNKTVVEGRVPWPGSMAELDLRIQMADESLSLLALVIGRPIDVSGQGRIDLKVTGPLAKPAVNGVVDLANLHLALPGILPGTFDQVTARIDFQGTRGVIRTAEGLYNGGSFSADGTVVFDNLDTATVDLSLTGRKVGFELSMMKARADADLTITGPLKAPLIKGKAVLADAVFSFAQGKKKSGKPSTSPVQLDIEVTNSNDVRVLVSNIVDVRGIGEVRLGGTISNLTLAGRAESTRGTITYADTIFNINSATANFTPLNGVIPNLVLQAETRVPEALIELAITGPTNDLQLALSSNPPMTEQEIVSKLSLPGRLSQLVQGAREGAWGAELIRLVDDELSSQVMGGLESVIREALQLDEFRIRQAFSEENIQLQFGKYLVDNLYVTYTRTLDTEDPLEYLGFEYRLNPNIIFNNSVSSDGEVRLGVETKLWF